jgi:alpha-beta hydrolase superfamily lysophospholipase
MGESKREERFEFAASDGKAISVRRFRASSRPRAAILIVHGMAEHGGRYARLASFLAERGMESWVPDNRGHGLTARGPGELGFMAERGGFLRVIEDLEGLSSKMKAELPGIPLFLLAHSLGSLMAQGIMARSGSEYSGVLLSGTAGPGNPVVVPGAIIGKVIRALKGPRARSPFLNAMALGSYNDAFKPPRTAFDWLSRDEAEVDAFLRDPLCGYVCSVSYYIDLAEGLSFIHTRDAMARIPKNLPVYLFAGSADPVGAASGYLDKLVDAYARLGIEDIEKRIYPGARHETLNETNRAEVMSDCAEWLEARIAGPSGTR